MNFGILCFQQVEELDFVGPWELLTTWSKYANGPSNCLIVAEKLEPIVCGNGLSINAHHSFSDCPTLDFLLVPGGQGTRREVNNPNLVQFVARQSLSCQAVLSVCTGSFILHAAGLLSGKKATTHWGSLDRLRALGDVEVVEQRYIRDGNVWSSAGVSAGADLMLAFISHFAGEETAGTVQLQAEYYPSSVKYGSAHNEPHAPAYIRD